MFRAPDVFADEEEDGGVEELWCGFPRASREARGYTVLRKLGQGGFGAVHAVRAPSGVEYACKSIEKRLDVPNLPQAKQQQHLDNIKREVTVLSRLRAALNVVHLHEVFEDMHSVHIIMELCTGGELLRGIGTRHYSERTVASYMRAVLRTLSQCHHHKILHRDIKPGNFMLLSDAEDAAVEAIDFGLAVFFDPKKLPVRDLGLEGTPHFMAPEVLSSEVYPESDVWSAGVMAYQLLSGRFPFDDWKNVRNPALSQLWKSILTEEPKLTGAAWDDVSEGAKDFIRQLLTKDPKQRPSAQKALEHPWVQGRKKQRTEGKPLAGTIVQRLQRYGTETAFKRTVLDMIANDLLQRHTAAAARAAPQPMDTSRHGALHSPGAPSPSGAGGAGARTAPVPVPPDGLKRRASNLGFGSVSSSLNLRALAAHLRERSVRNGSEHSMHGMDVDQQHDKCPTVHAASEAVAILKTRGKPGHAHHALPGVRHASVGSSMARLGGGARSVHSSMQELVEEEGGCLSPGSMDGDESKWLRMFGDMQQQRMKQQKIQRLMLDTSGRGGSQYAQLHPPLAAQASLEPVTEAADASSLPASKQEPAQAAGAAAAAPPSLARRSIFDAFEDNAAAQQQPGPAAPQPEEEGRRGRGAYAALFGGAKDAQPSTSRLAAPPGAPPPGGAHNQLPGIHTVKGVAAPPAAQQHAAQQAQQPQPAGWEGRPRLLAEGRYPTLLEEGEGEEGGKAQQQQQQQPGVRNYNIAAQVAALREPQPSPREAGRHVGWGPGGLAAQQQGGGSGSGRGGGAHRPSANGAGPAMRMSYTGGSQHGRGPSSSGAQDRTVSRGALYSVLGRLMGGPAQLAEFQAIMAQLRYDEQQELSFDQISEGLECLGYRLQPHEVEALMREVAVGGNNISQSAFLASQVDWREFQRNHREEWLECLRAAFQDLDKDRNGRIGANEILAVLQDKLPEDEVNQAVQDTLMDAAVMSEEGMDWDDFQALFQVDSMADLSAYESALSNGSFHGGLQSSGSLQNALSRRGSLNEVAGPLKGAGSGPLDFVMEEQQAGPHSGTHHSGSYHPTLETVAEGAGTALVK